jgi:hypothetical protein|tara:strand:+ start:17754 stop:18248 length:495 start_codon:yes stop_codon:yes gene_type:complete
LPLAYYYNLNKSDKSIYRKSDKIKNIKLNKLMVLRKSIISIKNNLQAEDKKNLEKEIREFLNQLTDSLDIETVNIKLLGSRPDNNWGELHGLYEQAEGRKKAKITLWMKTAKRKKVIAYKTFVRTLIHEVCHHFDYTLLKFEDSFHTEGFFYRESSLYKQLVIN